MNITYTLVFSVTAILLFTSGASAYAQFDLWEVLEHFDGSTSIDTQVTSSASTGGNSVGEGGSISTGSAFTESSVKTEVNGETVTDVHVRKNAAGGDSAEINVSVQVDGDDVSVDVSTSTSNFPKTTVETDEHDSLQAREEHEAEVGGIEVFVSAIATFFGNIADFIGGLFS